MEEERATATPTDLLNARQLDKLELEIRCLRNNISWLARLVPLLTIVAVVLSFFFTIYQMRTGFDNNVKILQMGVENDFKISEKEFRRKFYEEQFARYLELSETAAQLSTLDDQSKFQNAFQHLLELRNGKLIIVAENQDLLEKIDKFSKVVDQYNKKQVTKEDLAPAAGALAAACRNSVIRFWKIPVPEL